MSKAKAILLVCLLALLGAGLWLAWTLKNSGYSAREKPGRLEAFVAEHLRDLATPATAKSLKNPLNPTSLNIAEGRDHFADHCATYHANDGSGQTPIGKNVYPKVPDLRLADTQSMSDGEIFWVIHHGIRFTAMPAWGADDLDKDSDSWKLVHFIRHLPQLTPEELDQMKALNPKTKKDLEEEAAFGQFLQGDDAAAARTDSGHHH